MTLITGKQTEVGWMEGGWRAYKGHDPGSNPSPVRVFFLLRHTTIVP